MLCGKCGKRPVFANGLCRRCYFDTISIRRDQRMKKRAYMNEYNRAVKLKTSMREGRNGSGRRLRSGVCPNYNDHSFCQTCHPIGWLVRMGCRNDTLLDRLMLKITNGKLRW